MPRWPADHFSKRKCPQCLGPKDFNARLCRKCAPQTTGLLGRKGSDHPAWKGGRTIDRDGYVRLYKPDHPWPRRGGYVLEHVVVMELAIGRRLEPDETVHHKDHDRQNNDLANLEIRRRGEHSSHHRKLDVHRRERDSRGRFS
jgi:hypothetical protein